MPTMELFETVVAQLERKRDWYTGKGLDHIAREFQDVLDQLSPASVARG